jgi:cell division protein FtsB
MTWEQATQLILALVAASGAIGSFYAIRRQLKMERAEKKKLLAETESISAEVAAKLIDSAGDLQNFYTELFEELRKRLKINEDLICKLEGKIDLLTEENIKLKEKVEELEKGIEVLVKQIIELGVEPRYRRRK